MKNQTEIKKRALIVGATGLVGGCVLDLLLDDPTYEKVTVLGRRPLNRVAEKLKEYIVDFESLDESLLNSDVHAHDVFCCLGTTKKKAGSKEQFINVDLRYPLNLAQFCFENGSNRFFCISAMGANENSPFFYSEVKGKLEKYLKGIGFNGLFLFQPSLLLGDRDEKRVFEDLGKKMFKPLSNLMVGGLEKYRPIDAETVAQAMLIIAGKEQGGVHTFESDAIQKIAIET
ncbi:MAG: hypothetical protein ACI86H_000966 [bacterium]|jgi:uncharacterized protein YbjT (DUF2867 family)